jgi:hypothetical protein
MQPITKSSTNTIAGGFAGGGESSNARKCYVWKCQNNFVVYRLGGKIISQFRVLARYFKNFIWCVKIYEVQKNSLVLMVYWTLSHTKAFFICTSTSNIYTSHFYFSTLPYFISFIIFLLQIINSVCCIYFFFGRLSCNNHVESTII